MTEYIDLGNDSLTQLLNRRYLSTIVSREINFARKNDAALSLLAIDADYFKRINDKYGHTAGDLALRFIAKFLSDVAKGSDYAFRVGGEEFLLLLVDSDLTRALQIAENDSHADTGNPKFYRFMGKVLVLPSVLAVRFIMVILTINAF